MLDELFDAIGVDAARYALVQRSHDQVVELDLDLWAAQNAENPVYYCQYAHARTAAILRNAPKAEAGPAPAWTPEPPEVELVKHLAEFPEVVERGGGAARAAPDRRLCAGHRQGLPSVLQAVPRARRSAGRRAQPARALPRDEPGDGDGARPRRG